MLDKRGQGLSTNAIILIILGVIVLVILVLGFMMGWDKIAPWISSNNVDTIVNACDIVCLSNGIYDFCMKERDLKADDVKLKKITCNYLSKKKTEYGIQPCSSIPCNNVVFIEVTSKEVFESSDSCTGHEGKIIQALIEETLESRSCPAA